MEFEVDNCVYLKVSPMKGVMRFCKKGKHSPWCIGHYRISKRIGNATYKLLVPRELTGIYLVFHVSKFKKCMDDIWLILPTKFVWINDILFDKDIPIQILDHQVCMLKTKKVASVKVLWRNQFDKEATWKNEEDMNK